MVNKKSPQGLRGYMIRNNYEDTIFAIANKLNSKLDNTLDNRDNRYMSLDKDTIELAKLTTEFNNLVLKIIDGNTTVKEFVSERNGN